MTESRLKQLQARFGASIDAEIKRLLDRATVTPDFYGMMGYQLGYNDARLQVVEAHGGKRFRPLLCLLACEVTGGDWQSALPLAAGIELLHNFSLIHDDIEDHDPERRHRPTVWKLWGESHAINVGDGMFALANRAVIDASPDAHTALDLARALHETSLALTEGQYLDMTFETRTDVTVEEYAEMIARKTGALIAFSLWSGAILGRADRQTRKSLQRFGAELGNAFQIYDDVMGVWGTPDVTGKEEAKDLQNRKKTLPILLARAELRGDAADTLERFLSRGSNDLDMVLDALRVSEAERHSRERLQRHLERAGNALDEASISPASRDELSALAYELTGHTPALS